MDELKQPENKNGVDPSPNIATPLAETTSQPESQGAISMNKNTTSHTSPAIIYPSPIEFDNVEDFLDSVESAIGALEGAGIDFVVQDTLELLKGINHETGPADLRWLGDMIERNYQKFASEIEARQSDDGVNFLEDGATPTGEPDFIDPTPPERVVTLDECYAKLNNLAMRGVE